VRNKQWLIRTAMMNGNARIAENIRATLASTTMRAAAGFGSGIAPIRSRHAASSPTIGDARIGRRVPNH
jgi:hypothetical protein